MYGRVTEGREIRRTEMLISFVYVHIFTSGADESDDVDIFEMERSFILLFISIATIAI